MKKLALSLSAGVIAVLSMSAPALADPRGNSNANGQGFQVGGLPDGSKFPKSRLHVNIIDTSPIVTDNRPPIEGPNNTIINIPPRQVIPGTTTVVGNPNGGSGGPVVVPLNSSGLPAANFGSQPNYKANTINPNLAPGQSTGVHGPTGAAAMPAQAKSSGGNTGHGTVNASMKTQQQPIAKTYPNTHDTGSSGSGVNANVSVSARRIKPGALMDRLNNSAK
jgi:hypothetical protein